jgi:DNA-binding beta-propeller fold protein YncE
MPVLVRRPPEGQLMLAYPLRPLFVAIVLVAMLFMLVGCGSEQGSSEDDAPEQEAPEERAAPEPAEAQPLEEEPAGEVVEVGNEPEGVVADPETGLVAVGLRDPGQLALVDGGNREVIRNVKLPESPRHLQLAAPGGPILVPAEGSDTLVQVSLPEGEITSETMVGANPHDAAVAPDGRIFVGNEFSDDTASVIEGGREIERIEVPVAPGGVAATDDGLVGVIGVRGLELEVFDASTLESLGRAEAGEGPTHLVVGPDNRFYVADTRGGTILVYEASPEPKQTGQISLPGSPYGIAMDPERSQLWVTLTEENQVVQLALGEGTLRELARYPTVREPNTVAVDTVSGRVFVTGRADGELQILDPQ